MLINAKVLRGFLLIICVDKQENPSKSICNQSSPLKAVCRVRLLVEISDESNVSESQTFFPLKEFPLDFRGEGGAGTPRTF